MEPRISLVTLGVSDLERSYRFYKDGLGLPVGKWTPAEGVVFFQTRGTTLALYPFEKLAEDVDPKLKVSRPPFAGITLAHNTRTKEEVDALLARAEKAGAKIVKAAQDTFWGGYSGYFADPDGYLWEIAYGAFEFNEDGSLIIP